MLVFGSLGFSAVTADRGVSASVVDDSEAYVGYATEDIDGVTVGDEITLVEVTNRFASSTNDLEIDDARVTIVDSDGIEIDASLPDSGFDAGESETVTGEVTECTPSEHATVQVTIEVSDTNVHAEVFGDVEYREFEIECKSQAESVTEKEDTLEVSTFNGSDRKIEFELETIDGVGIDDIEVDTVTVKTPSNLTFVDEKRDVTTEDNTLRAEIKRFEVPKGFGVGNPSFVDPDSDQADVVVEFTFSDGSEYEVGIELQGAR